MSLSKEKLPGATAELPRQPKCSRCRHHGVAVPQKGHTKFCPFLKCACSRCLLITERTRITALQRNLRRAEENKQKNKEKRPSAGTGDGVTRPAADGARGASVPAGGARPLAALHLSNVTGAPEDAVPVTMVQSPPDLRPGPAAGGEHVAGSDTTDVRAFSSAEERGHFTPLSVPYFGELRPSAPVPFIHYPFRMPGHYPSSYAPCPDFMITMPWLPPAPAGLYTHGLYRPLMFPHFQQGAVHYPSPPEPGLSAECKQVFFTLQPPPLPEAFQEDLMSTQHPQPPLAKHADPDIVELD